MARGTTSTATSVATGESERDLSGVSVNGGMRMTTEVLRGKRADLVVVIQSPKVEPEMTHFSWYIPVDACARGWCEPNPLSLGFINNTELQSWTQNVLAMTSRPFFISTTQDVVSQDPRSPPSGPTISRLPNSISDSDPAPTRPTFETATRMLPSVTPFPPPTPTPGNTATTDRESLLGYFLVAFICFCLGSAFTLAVLSCLRRFQENRRHRSRAFSPTESDIESSSFSTDPITGSGTHRGSEDPPSTSAETSRASIGQPLPRGYCSTSDPGPSLTSSSSNNRKSMAAGAFYQHQLPSESWSDPGIGVGIGAAGSKKSTLRAQQHQTSSAAVEVPTMTSTASKTHLAASTSKKTHTNTRIQSDGSIRTGFELARVATAHSATFVRPAAVGERVGPGEVRLGSIGGVDGGGSVSEPTLPPHADGLTKAKSPQHAQAQLVHFSKQGQGVVSGPHEATAAVSSTAGRVDPSDSVEVSSCHRTVTSDDGSVATVVGVCFDMIPAPPHPSPAAQPAAESSLEIVETSITVLAHEPTPLIITTTLTSPPVIESENESHGRPCPISTVDPTTIRVTPPQQLPPQDLRDAVSSSNNPSLVNNSRVFFDLPSPPVPQRQRSLTGLPIANRHRTRPIRDLDLRSAARPLPPFPQNASGSGVGGTVQAAPRNFRLPIILPGGRGISDALQSEGFDVQNWHKPAALEEQLGHITTIEELEEYALCGEIIMPSVGSPPVIRAPGTGLQSCLQAGQSLPTTTADDEIGASSSSNTADGSSQGAISRLSVRSLESRIELLKEFPLPPPTVVVTQAANEERIQGDSGSGLGL
ncbi:unnamed protein product [Mortierella alpina]